MEIWSHLSTGRRKSGGAFGIAIIASHGSVRFAAVDDDLNTVTVWTVHPEN